MGETLRYPPLPPGTPHLMPYETEPFNGDTFAEVEVLRLKEAHGLLHAIETGTCYGSTTMWLALHIEDVMTIELSDQYREIAGKRFNLFNTGHICWMGGDSATGISSFIKDCRGEPTLCFLDAHWGQSCPLLDELTAIAGAGIRPCILIHDFHVPGTDFGFDSMPDGRPFDLGLVRSYLNRIYGEGKWTHNYPTEVAGARRGWISIEPA